MMAGYIGIWIVFCFNLVVSSPDECQQERDRLQAQLSSMEARAVKQKVMIQRFMDLSQQPPISENKSVFFDLRDKQYADCAQIFKNDSTKSGFYMIKPEKSQSTIKVYCNMRDGGGWTVFQRRTNGNESFNRDWNDYKTGFGNMKSASGEFWLGNDNLHYLTSQGNYSLRIDFEDFEGSHRFAIYRMFQVDSELNHYQLKFDGYKGNAGDSLAGSNHPEMQGWASHQGMKFSTKDKDNDQYKYNCALEDMSGWWFNRCHSANLNGLYYKGPYSTMTDNGIVWYTWHGWWYSLKTVEMKIRPSDFETNEA